MPPQPLAIEVVTITAGQIGVAFLVWVGVISLAYWLGVLTGVWGQRAGAGVRAEPDEDDQDDPDATVEMEISPPAARRRRPPKTGTVHAPHLPSVPADDPTVVIGHAGEVPR